MSGLPPARRSNTLAARLGRNPAAGAGVVLLLLALAAITLARWLAPYPPDAIDLARQLSPPSAGHPLGTDFYGRDLLSRVLYGGRATLAVSVAAVILSALAGGAIGLLAGASRGWASQAWVALIDLLLAFPALLLALLMVAVIGPGLAGAALAVGIAGVPAYARLVRSVVMTLRTEPYVDAAYAVGAGPARVLLRHVLPGVIAPVLAFATADLGRAIISVAALGFLGLGAPPPLAEWGLMLYEGRGYLATAPWASAFPGLAITLTVLAVTLLGDAVSPR